MAAAAIVAAVWLAAAKSRAERMPSIAVDAPDDCSAALRLADRVREALIGEPAADLQASVTIEQRDGLHQATVRTTRGAAELGVKVVSAPTCDEAVDAAVVVLAMALAKQSRSDAPAPIDPASEPAPPSPSASPEPPASHSPPAPSSSPSPAPSPTWSPPRFQRTADPRTPDRPSPAPTTSRTRRTAVAILGGIDVGTVDQAALYVGARVSTEVGPLELRGTARYGLPRAEEEDNAGVVTERRVDFGAFDADACYGRGAAWHAGLCAGAEVGVVRDARRSGAEGNVEDTDAAEPRLAGTLAARVGYRAGMLQPELEVAGAAAALAPAGASRFAVRAGLGLGVQF